MFVSVDMFSFGSVMRRSLCVYDTLREGLCSLSVHTNTHIHIDTDKHRHTHTQTNTHAWTHIQTHTESATSCIWTNHTKLNLKPVKENNFFHIITSMVWQQLQIGLCTINADHNFIKNAIGSNEIPSSPTGVKIHYYMFIYSW